MINLKLFQFYTSLCFEGCICLQERSCMLNACAFFLGLYFLSLSYVLQLT